MKIYKSVIVSHGYGISAIWKEDLEILEKSLNDGWEIVNSTSQSVEVLSILKSK